MVKSTHREIRGRSPAARSISRNSGSSIERCESRVADMQRSLGNQEMGRRPSAPDRQVVPDRRPWGSLAQYQAANGSAKSQLSPKSEPHAQLDGQPVTDKQWKELEPSLALARRIYRSRWNTSRRRKRKRSSTRRRTFVSASVMPGCVFFVNDSVVRVIRSDLSTRPPTMPTSMTCLSLVLRNERGLETPMGVADESKSQGRDD